MQVRDVMMEEILMEMAVKQHALWRLATLAQGLPLSARLLVETESESQLLRLVMTRTLSMGMGVQPTVRL